MGHSFLSPRATVREAGGKGLGIYAIESFKKNDTVCAFGGEVMHKRDFDQLPEFRRIHGIQIDDELYVAGGDELEPADMANHSCDPNCGIMGSIVLVAMRDIEVGEELCFDYAMCDAADYDEFICACGTAECRKVVTSADWQRPELQRRYDGYMSAYLARRIAANHPTS